MAPHTRLNICHDKHTGACSKASLYFNDLFTKYTSSTVLQIMATGKTHIQPGLSVDPAYKNVACMSVCLSRMHARRKNKVIYSKADVGAASMIEVAPDMAGLQRKPYAVEALGFGLAFCILHASVVPQIPIRRLNHTASALEDDTCSPISPDDFTLAWVFVSWLKLPSKYQLQKKLLQTI